MEAADPKLLTALGPLASLFLDLAVTEIRADAPDRVYVVRRGTFEDVPDVFSSADEMRKVIDAILALSGLRLREGQTVAEARLPDGSHFVAAVPPTSGTVPVLAIRRLSGAPLDWDKLVELKVITPLAQSLLVSFVRSDSGILVAGNAGSGKTTLANLLAESIGHDRRIVAIHDVIDLPIKHPRAVHLEANVYAGVSVSDLLDTAVRLRPDWIIVPELRGPETLRALQVMSSGHTGLTVMHANGPEDAMIRLETMCLTAKAGLGPFEIRSLIESSLQVVLVMERLPLGRRLTHIGDLRVVGDRLEVRTLLRYNPATDKLDVAGLPAEQRIKDYLSGGFAWSDRRQRRLGVKA